MLFFLKRTDAFGKIILAVFCLRVIRVIYNSGLTFPCKILVSQSRFQTPLNAMIMPLRYSTGQERSAFLSKCDS